MDPRRQKSLMEAAVLVVAPKQQEMTQSNTLTELAESYITSILGNELNECTDQNERNEMIADLVEQTNLICHAINTYFDLY